MSDPITNPVIDPALIDEGAKVSINAEAILGAHNLAELTLGPVTLSGLNELEKKANQTFRISIEKIAGTQP